MPSIETFSEAVNAFGVELESDPYAKAAKRIYGEDGRIEFDDHVVLSTGDEGAYVMAWVWVPNSALEPEAQAAVGDQPSDSSFVTSQFLNHYKCPSCGHTWSDVWTAQCDDDCPSCGARHISPHKSDDA